MTVPSFQLSDVVPWGRSYEEYLSMFRLTDKELAGKRILGCGDGPASFNAEAKEKGLTVISSDPLYAFNADDIARRIDETKTAVMEQVRKNQDNYVWNNISSPDALEWLRTKAMTRFLEDYRESASSTRYVAASLPLLPFRDKQFDLALVSHFLFLYSDHFDLDLHIASLVELIRVAGEVRIFPLVDLSGAPSPHLQPVKAKMASLSIRCSVTKADYEFQAGANKFLILNAE